MNRIRICLITLFLALAAGFSASAQERSFRIGLAGAPIFQLAQYWGCCDYYVEPGAGGLYRDSEGPAYTLGALVMTYEVRKSRLLSIGAVMSNAMSWQTYTNVVTGRRHTDTCVDTQILATAQLNILERGVFSWYGYAGAGLGAMWGESLLPACQISPFCFKLDTSSCYIFAEAGLGTVYCGGQIGLGIRF